MGETGGTASPSTLALTVSKCLYLCGPPLPSLSCDDAGIKGQERGRGINVVMREEHGGGSGAVGTRGD